MTRTAPHDRRRRRKFNWLAVWLTLSIALILAGAAMILRPTLTVFQSNADRLGFPSWLRRAPADVQRSYARTVAYRDDLTYIPCYCGCGQHSGHRSVADCHVQDIAPDGTITYDPHAADCQMCVDAAMDAVDMIEQGVPLSEVRTRIDAQYSQFGPGTDTPLPPG